MRRKRYLGLGFAPCLALLLAGCNTPPSATPTVVPTILPFRAAISSVIDREITLSVNGTLVLDATSEGGEAVRYEWEAQCLLAEQAECEKALGEKNTGSRTIIIKAPNRPGETIAISATAIDKDDHRSLPSESLQLNIVMSPPNPTATILPTPTPLSTDTTSDAPIAVFTSPSTDGQTVPYQSLCTGSITNMPLDHQLWLVVYPHDNLKYHPQNGPAAISSQGGWRNACYVGGPSPSYAGLKVDILAVLVDDAGAQEFKDYLTNAPTMNPPWDGIPSLPAGAQIVGQIIGIVRQ